MLTLKNSIFVIIVIAISLFFLGKMIYSNIKEKREEGVKKETIKKINDLDWSSVKLEWEIIVKECKKTLVTKIIIPGGLNDQIKEIFNSCPYGIKQYVYVGCAFYDINVRDQLTEYSECFDGTNSLILLSEIKMEKKEKFLVKNNLNIYFDENIVKNINKEFFIEV